MKTRKNPSNGPLSSEAATDSDSVVCGDYEDFSIPRCSLRTCSGNFFDHFDRSVQKIVVDDDHQHHILRQFEGKTALRLACKTEDVANGHPLHGNLVEGLLDGGPLFRSDEGKNPFHGLHFIKNYPTGKTGRQEDRRIAKSKRGRHFDSSAAKGENCSLHRKCWEFRSLRGYEVSPFGRKDGKKRLCNPHGLLGVLFLASKNSTINWSSVLIVEGTSMKLRIIRVDLPLKHVFTTSRRSISVVRTIVVELEQDGLRGHGEAYEDQLYSTDVETMTSVVEQCREHIDHYALADPVAFWRYLNPILGGNKFAQSAVDCAACDLWGKMKNKQLWKIWGLSLDRLPMSSLSIGIDSEVRILERLAESPDWPVYTIKLGDKNDMETLRMLRRHTTVPFRVDVNGAWSVDTAIKNLAEMKDLNIQLLEQPLAAGDWEGMKKLRKEIKKKNYDIPVFADEAWKTEADIDRCVGLFDGINLKLPKCGGLTPARLVAAKAKHLGLRLMSASSIESTIGVSAICQLAPLFDFIGIDGPLLIEKKVGIGVHAEKGKLVYSSENGTGVRTTFR